LIEHLLHDDHFCPALDGDLRRPGLEAGSRAITGALDERAARIRTEPTRRAGREEAERLLADYQRQEREATTDAQAIVARPGKRLSALPRSRPGT
jgi:hypothetical protein